MIKIRGKFTCPCCGKEFDLTYSKDIEEKENL